MIHKVCLPSTTISSTLLAEALRTVFSFENDEDDYVLFTFSDDVEVSDTNLQRMSTILAEGDYDAVYSDYHCDEKVLKLLDYTEGGRLREDFDFGKIMLVKKSSIQYNPHLTYSAFYYLRLALKNVCHLKEPLYSSKDKNSTDLFAYQDPKCKDAQKEFEEVCKDYLWKRGALLRGAAKAIDFDDELIGEKGSFPVEASVIIPVLNRVKTIKDAVESALSQKTDFNYNVIVIDNHSTDGTTQLLNEIEDERLIHIIPEETTLRIGGCWNKGVNHPLCGRFAVQLDSDDIYSSENTLQRIVDTFHKEAAGMVIGSYSLTDFKGKSISDHLIDHSEWTEENGRNNAL
ncbi:MAG: glycosyltransferase family 2 protein, partial [Bacteroidales bacterium]|nr:glycosyltransferase family 2 protein [Bacteroidales bacterium]